jgi:peroxiredoxin
MHAETVKIIVKRTHLSGFSLIELWWIIVYCTDVPSSKEAIELYSRDYSDNFPIKCAIIDRPASWADHCFHAMAERSPDRQIRGQATLARARFQELVMHDQATTEKLLETVINQYAGVKASPQSAATVDELAHEDLNTLHSPNPNLDPKVPSAGETFPPFEVNTTDGKTVRMPADYKGKVVLIDYWATWCVPCVAEIPNIASAYGKYHGRGLEVLSVSLDKENAGEALANFTRKHGMEWPQIYDGKFEFTPLARRFNILGGSGIPFALLVDGDTRVIIAEGKDLRGAKLAPAIEAALTKEEPAANK